MIWRYSFTPGDDFCVGFVGSWRKASDCAPTPVPAGEFSLTICITAGSIDTEVTYSNGFQPSFAAPTNAWIASFGSAKMTNVSAPDARSCCTWGSTSVSSNAYDSVETICPACLPSPFFRPASSSLPYSSPS